MTRILALSGSNRVGSMNTALLDRAVARLAEARQREVDLATAGELEFPLYSQDLEDASGIPPAVRALFGRVGEADALLVASPEHNGGYSAHLKNVVDWVTRVDMTVFASKKVGVITASPGGGGGARSAAKTRHLFEDIGASVHPESFSLARAHDALTEDDIPELAAWLESWSASLDHDSEDERLVC